MEGREIGVIRTIQKSKIFFWKVSFKYFSQKTFYEDVNILQIGLIFSGRQLPSLNTVYSI